MTNFEVHSWSKQYAARQKVAERFGKIHQLPIRRRVREVLRSYVNPGDEVLEIGAGDRGMGNWLAEQRPGVRYFSLDPDPALPHDFRSLDEVPAKFDCIYSFEVVEHIPWDQIPGWLSRIAGLLHPGGRLLLSTPNTFYPPDFLRDATHCTPLCYDELGGVVERSGLKVSGIYRIYHDPVHRAFLRRYAFGWLFQMLGLDFAKQIVLAAEKEEG